MTSTNGEGGAILTEDRAQNTAMSSGKTNHVSEPDRENGGGDGAWCLTHDSAGSVSGEGPLSYGCLEKELFMAVKFKSVEECEDLLRKIKDVNVMGENGVTPLQLAVELGKLNWTEMLLLMGSDPKILNKAGRSVLLLAEGLCRMFPFDSERRIILRLVKLASQLGGQGREASVAKRGSETSRLYPTTEESGKVVVDAGGARTGVELDGGNGVTSGLSERVEEKGSGEIVTPSTSVVINEAVGRQGHFGDEIERQTVEEPVDNVVDGMVHENPLLRKMKPSVTSFAEELSSSQSGTDIDKVRSEPDLSFNPVVHKDTADPDSTSEGSSSRSGGRSDVVTFLSRSLQMQTGNVHEATIRQTGPREGRSGDQEMTSGLAGSIDPRARDSEETFASEERLVRLAQDGSQLGVKTCDEERSGNGSDSPSSSERDCIPEFADKGEFDSRHLVTESSLSREIACYKSIVEGRLDKLASILIELSEKVDLLSTEMVSLKEDTETLIDNASIRETSMSELRTEVCSIRRELSSQLEKVKADTTSGNKAGHRQLQAVEEPVGNVVDGMVHANPLPRKMKPSVTSLVEELSSSKSGTDIDNIRSERDLASYPVAHEAPADPLKTFPHCSSSSDYVLWPTSNNKNISSQGSMQEEGKSETLSRIGRQVAADEEPVVKAADGLVHGNPIPREMKPSGRSPTEKQQTSRSGTVDDEVESEPGPSSNLVVHKDPADPLMTLTERVGSSDYLELLFSHYKNIPSLGPLIATYMEQVKPGALSGSGACSKQEKAVGEPVHVEQDKLVHKDAILRTQEARLPSLKKELSGPKSGRTLEGNEDVAEAAVNLEDCVACTDALLAMSTCLGPRNSVNTLASYFNLIYSQGPLTSSMLEYLRVQGRIRIMLDFKNRHMLGLVPKFNDLDGMRGTGKVNKAYVDCNRRTVYVGAKTKGPYTADDVVGWLTISLARLSIFMAFGNDCKPYHRSDRDAEMKFGNAVQQVKDIFVWKGSYDCDCNCYIINALGWKTPAAQEIALISAVPGIIAHYGVVLGVKILREQAPSLLEYYQDHVVPKFEREARL